MAISSAPKARKVFVSHPRASRRAALAIQTAHLPCAKSPFWWVTFREQTWVTSRERRSHLDGILQTEDSASSATAGATDIAAYRFVYSA